MPTIHDPDDIRMHVSFPVNTVTGSRRVEIGAELADTGEALFLLDLSPGQFASLLAASAVTARSATPVPRGLDCQEDNHSDHGDCNGSVREYTVTGPNLFGLIKGERVALCANHAQTHGRFVRRPEAV